MSKAQRRVVNHDSPQAAAWRRHGLLASAVILTGAGLVVGVVSESNSSEFSQGVLLKTGIVTFMWWLALPQLRKLNPYATAAVGVLALVAIIRPQLLLLIGKVAIPIMPLLFLIWLFWKLKRK